MNLESILLNCQNPDAVIRRQAEGALVMLEEKDTPQCMMELSKILVDETKDQRAQHLAGLELKNLLSAKDEELMQRKVNAWLEMDVGLRGQIKMAALTAMKSASPNVRRAAAQLVAKIGVIELPRKLWNELLDELLGSVKSSPDHVKVASLESLGYMCEEWDAGEIAQDQTNSILTLIVEAMKPNSPDIVRFAASTALRNSLDFTTTNFENKAERDMIMKVVLEATQCKSSAPVRTVAFECIAEIATLYYTKLEAYIQYIFQLTISAIQNDFAEVGVQAIEFWSSLAEEEIALIEDEAPCLKYIEKALPHLVQVLTKTLTKQDEYQDDNSAGIAMAAGACLSYVSLCVEDQIIQYVLPFVTGNILSPDWRLREASTMAFASILEGPGEIIITPVIQALPVLIKALGDENDYVKDTTAWTIGRICELHPISIRQETFEQLIPALLRALNDTARVASKACFAIHNLAAAFKLVYNQNTNMLSKHISVVLTELLKVTDRADWEQENLRMTAYEAINMLIENSALDVRPIIVELVPMIIARLENTMKMQILSADDREEQQNLQSLLCGVLTVLALSLDAEILPHADRMMELFGQVLYIKGSISHEDAFMAVGALASKLEANFERYMPNFQPALLNGLRNREEYQVCIVAVGVVGDLSRALEAKILPYCDDIITALLENLQDSQLNRNVKPPVLSCFGDISLAIGGNFVKYLGFVMNMLKSASEKTMNLEADDEDLIDYLNQLREAILESYTGIIQGLKEDNKALMMSEHVAHIVNFIKNISGDKNKDESIVRNSLGVIGDLGDALGDPIVPYFKNEEFVKVLYQDGMVQGSDSTRRIAEWCSTIMQKIGAF